MFFKKYLLVILIFLSLICSISAVSAENTILADDSINDQNMDFDAQPSVSIGVLDDSTLDASSSSSDDRSSADDAAGISGSFFMCLRPQGGRDHFLRSAEPDRHQDRRRDGHDGVQHRREGISEG